MTSKKKVALVTGSTAGLGYEIACALSKSGVRVAMNYRSDHQRAEAAFNSFTAGDGDGMLFCGDVTSEDGVRELAERVGRQMGGVDILVVNATPPQPQKTLLDYRWDEVQTMLDAFVKSPFLLSQQVVPHMKAQRWGRIINIGSEVFSDGTPNFTAYVAAKGGQVGLSRSLALELAPLGITVNTIAPGWIPVERHEGIADAMKETYRQTIPMGHFGVPDDVANAVVFLAGEEARFITAAHLHVNGGRTVQ